MIYTSEMWYVVSATCRITKVVCAVYNMLCSALSPFDRRKSQNVIISFLNSFCVYAYMVLFACVVWGPTLAHSIIVVTSVCVGGGRCCFE